MEEILIYENEFNFIQEIKKINENEKIEKEKIKIKEEIKNNNLRKIKLNKNEIK